MNNNKMRSRIKFGLTMAIIMILTTFCMIGCQNEAISNNVAVAANSGAATLRVSIDEPQSESRAALPSVDLSQLSFIMLTYDDPADNEIAFKTVGMWGSTDQTSCVDEMQNAVLTFQVGTYKFSLTAMASGMMFTETKSFTITGGENHLSFTPKLEILSNELRGKGNLSVTLDLSCDMTNLEKVTGGLYSIGGLQIIGAEDKDLTIDEHIEIGYKRTWVEYALQNVPSGDYVVIFKFFADNDKKKLLSTYREYTSIIDDMTSDSECVIEALGKVFSIEYEMNGGQFANDYTPQVSYTRQTAVVTLPPADKITRSHYDFDGWYDNPEFTGDAVKNITAGNTGNKKYYAKWISKVRIIFSPNGGTIRTDEMELRADVTGDLPTAATLGLIAPTSRSFIGWAKTSNAENVEYTDGAKIKVSENTVLYAIWSIATIRPKAGDNDDTDGDGLADWDELNIYKTDPSNPDTDGDGWTDGEELRMINTETLTFSPLIADVPLLEVVFDKKPSIMYNFQKSDNKVVSEEIGTNEGTTQSKETEHSNTKSREVTHGWEFGFEYGYSWEASNKGAHFNIHGTYSGSVASGDEYTFGQHMTEEMSKEWSHSKSTSSEEGKTVTGGSIKIQARFKNPSNIAYNIESVTVAISRVPNNDPSSLIPIASITKENLGVIPPGQQSGPVNLEVDKENALTIEETEELLKWSSGINITVSAYKITLTKDGATSDFTDSLTRVKAQTAAVYVDWGVESRMPAQTYNVSVFNKYNVNATSMFNAYTKPTLKDIFDEILNYHETTDATQDGKFYTLDNGVLKGIGGIANKAVATDGQWYICHAYDEGNKRMKRLTHSFSDFETRRINAGDEISIIYSVDKDGDGVPLNEELAYGTDDTNSDTDGDGLNDKEELYGWYKSHLVSPKYSESKKVCTNPRLNDSDGDDLFDYIANYDSASEDDKAKVDNDPIDPKMKDDTSLKINEYAVESGENKFKDLEFRVSSQKYDGISKVYETSVEANELIYLNIVPKVLFAEAGYYALKPGMPPVDLNTIEFASIKKTDAISLMVGGTTIIVQCTAPDGDTKALYLIYVSSSFIPMKKFSVKSPDLENGRVNLSWDTYADSRSGEDGGYILYGVKSTTLQTSPKLDSDHTNPATETSLTGKSEFWVALDKKTLASHTTSVTLDTNTDYCLYLFAFAHPSKTTTYKSTCLGKAKVKTGKPEKGVLTFYAHYIYDYKDQDGGYDPQYYWRFSGGQIKDISVLNIGEGDKKEFDDDDDKSYCFGEGKIHKYNNDPLKFSSNCTKELKTEFSRKEPISFTVEWTAWEYDFGSGDDKLGTVTANFSYTPSSDTWTCKWTSTSGKDDHSTIRTGERTGKINGSHNDGKRWELHNSSYGEIEFHWDWGWDYKD